MFLAERKVKMSLPTQSSVVYKKFHYTDQFNMTWDDFTPVDRRPTHGPVVRDAFVKVDVRMILERSGTFPVAGSAGNWRLGYVLVESVVNKSKSPVYKKALVNAKLAEHLLEHERGHVELFERYARGMYFDLLGLSSKHTDLDAAALDLARQALKLRDEYFSKINNVNKSYDTSTGMGADLDKQKRWSSVLLRKKGTNTTLRIKK